MSIRRVSGHSVCRLSFPPFVAPSSLLLCYPFLVAVVVGQLSSSSLRHPLLCAILCVFVVSNLSTLRSTPPCHAPPGLLLCWNSVYKCLLCPPQTSLRLSDKPFVASTSSYRSDISLLSVPASCCPPSRPPHIVYLPEVFGPPEEKYRLSLRLTSCVEIYNRPLLKLVYRPLRSADPHVRRFRNTDAVPDRVIRRHREYRQRLPQQNIGENSQAGCSYPAPAQGKMSREEMQTHDIQNIT